MDGAWRETCCSRDNLKLSRPIPVLENIVRIWTGNAESRVPYDGPRTEKNKHLLLIFGFSKVMWRFIRNWWFWISKIYFFDPLVRFGSTHISYPGCSVSTLVLKRASEVAFSSDFNHFYLWILHSVWVKTLEGFGFLFSLGWAIAFLIFLFYRGPRSSEK